MIINLKSRGNIEVNTEKNTEIKAKKKALGASVSDHLWCMRVETTKWFRMIGYMPRIEIFLSIQTTRQNSLNRDKANKLRRIYSTYSSHSRNVINLPLTLLQHTLSSNPNPTPTPILPPLSYLPLNLYQSPTPHLNLTLTLVLYTNPNPVNTNINFNPIILTCHHNQPLVLALALAQARPLSPEYKYRCRHVYILDHRCLMYKNSMHCQCIR